MPMLPRVHPMRLRLVKEPFDNPDYLYELKHDGFRAPAYIERGECKLVYRNLEHLRFSALEEALATPPVQNDSFLPSLWSSSNQSLLGSRESALLCNQVGGEYPLRPVSPSPYHPAKHPPHPMRASADGWRRVIAW